MYVNSVIKQNRYPPQKCDKDLQQIFAACFSVQHRTALIGEASEPLYTPAVDSGDMHTIYYRHDYFSSALHEVAHWCIAGEKRRQLEDYGYWYAPNGRTTQQQQDFQLVELKPQAIEWAFSLACDIDFSVSIDNLHALDNKDDAALRTQESLFKKAVKKQLEKYFEFGFPVRALVFLKQLQAFYKTPTRGLSNTASDDINGD